MIRQTWTVERMIKDGQNIFDFEYPFYDETKRKDFETNFIENFLFDEIAHETPARFKKRLALRFRLIMPYWNKVFEANNLEQRILNNYDVEETFTKTSNNNGTSTNNNTNKNLFSDTPTTKVDFENVDYFSSITKDIGSNTNTSSDNGAENWTRKMTGNIGVATDADAVVNYTNSLRQIEIEIFNQCQDLFMGVY